MGFGPAPALNIEAVSRRGLPLPTMDASQGYRLPPSARPESGTNAPADPLGDMLDWLGHADLGDDEDVDGLNGRRAALGSDGGGARVFARPSHEPPPGRLNLAGSAGSFAGEPPPFQGRAPAAGSDRKGPHLTGYCGIGKDEAVRSEIEPEEREWDERQQQTGAAGRLVVYEKDDHPRHDLLLRGGGARRIIVANVTEGGKAAQAGVKAGDVLVSIGGKKDFKGLTADEVHRNLTAPVMLVFMGFVGKLQAEVRLNYKQKICGLSSQHQVVYGRPEAPVKVVDEVIFQPGSATLFLAIVPPEEQHRQLQRRLQLQQGLNEFDSSLASALRPGAPGTGIASGDSDMPLGEEDYDEEPTGDIADLTEGSVGRPGAAGSSVMPDLGIDYGAPRAQPMDSEQPGFAGVYELRSNEARNLVNRALARARTAASASAAPSAVEGSTEAATSSGTGFARAAAAVAARTPYESGMTQTPRTMMASQETPAFVDRPGVRTPPGTNTRDAGGRGAGFGGRATNTGPGPVAGRLFDGQAATAHGRNHARRIYCDVAALWGGECETKS